MPRLAIVTAHDLLTLQKLGLTSGPGIILTTRHALEHAGLTEDEARQRADDYDFGGEADLWVEVAFEQDHYFFNPDA